MTAPPSILHLDSPLGIRPPLHCSFFTSLGGVGDYKKWAEYSVFLISFFLLMPRAPFKIAPSMTCSLKAKRSFSSPPTREMGRL